LVNKGYPLPDILEEPNFDDPVSRGKYLVQLTECAGCHTGWYARNPGIFGGGNPMGHNEEHIFSPNISSDVTGIGAWTEEAFIAVMKSGKGGFLDAKMPWISFKNLTDEDLGAIYQALMTSYPVRHIVLNRAPITYCEVCQMEHGMGSQNKLEPIKAFIDNYKIPSDLAGVYYDQMFERDTLRISYNQGKLALIRKEKEWQLIPINETAYISEGFFAPIDFIRNIEGQVTDFQFRNLGRATYRKID
jgi:hypothetical protein